MSNFTQNLKTWLQTTPVINKIKRKHLIWLWLLVPLTGILTPIIVLVGTQSKLNTAQATYFANDTTMYKNDVQFKEFTKKQSLKELVYGSKKVNDGNYVIFFATGGATRAPQNKSQTNNSLENKQLFYPRYDYNQSLDYFFSANNSQMSNPSYIDDYEPSVHQIKNLNVSDQSVFIKGIQDSIYFNDFNFYGEDKISLNFYSYLADYEKMPYGRTVEIDGIPYESKDLYVSPYYKWTDTDTNNYIFNNNLADDSSNAKARDINGYNWYKKHRVDEYALKSQGAKDFRETIDTFNKLMVNNIVVEPGEVEAGIVAVAWLNGTPTKKILLKYDLYSGYDNFIYNWKSFLDDAYGNAIKA